MKVRFLKVLPLLVLLISFFLFLFQLGKNSLIEFDEGIYALVAKRMADSGDLITLQWREGVPWFDKGPLYFWLTAPLLKLFGFSPFSVRFWSSFLGFLTVICVFLIGRRILSDAAAVISAMILSSTIGFLYYARLGMLDVPNAFFNTSAMLFLVMSERNIKYLYLFVATSALGFLNRGFLSLLAPVSFLVYIAIFNRGLLKHKKEWLISLTIFLLISVPWHVVMYQRYGTDFLNTYFGHQMFSRFFNVIEGKDAPTFWYLTVIKTHFRIWLIPLMAGLPLVIYKLFKVDKPMLLLVFWTALIFSVFTISRSKLIWYIMPVYPPLSLMVGYIISLVLRSFPRFVNFGIALLVLVGFFYVGRLWNRVVTDDFNKDLVAVVKIGNDVSGIERLLLANFAYSVSSFHSRYEVKALPAEELPGFISDKDLAVISREDALKFNKSFSFKEVYQSGNVLLIKKEVVGK